MSAEIKAIAYEMIKEIIEQAEDDSEERTRDGEARCICGWNVEFVVENADSYDVASQSTELFNQHVASGDCPEKRDDEGNIIT